jgi:integrase
LLAVIAKIEDDGTWTVSFCKRNPKTGVPVSLRRKLIKTKAEAQRIERFLIGEVERKINEAVFPSWAQMVDSYLAACRDRGLAEKSIYNADKCLKAATLNLWGKRPVNTITTQEIRDLITKTYGESSSTHQKGILKFIRGTFLHAVELGDLQRNPTPDIKFKIQDKIRKVLTETQARSLLAKAKEFDWEWYPHCAMALYTGMRNGELFALTWDKVTFESRKILVDSSWNNKNGFKSTKSGDDRMVEIAPSLLPILQELKLKTGSCKFVLPRMSRWEKGEQARELRMFLVGIGLPPVRFHDLRATWATLMLSKGVAPVKVMSMGGWKDMKTMMIYIRKAGIDIQGITDQFSLHDPLLTTAQVIGFPGANRAGAAP